MRPEGSASAKPNRKFSGRVAEQLPFKATDGCLWMIMVCHKSARLVSLDRDTIPSRGCVAVVTGLEAFGMV